MKGTVLTFAATTIIVALEDFLNEVGSDPRNGRTKCKVFPRYNFRNYVHKFCFPGLPSKVNVSIVNEGVPVGSIKSRAALSQCAFV